MRLSFADIRTLILAKKIKPVVKLKVGALPISQVCYIDPVDLKRPDYAQNAKAVCKAERLVKLASVNMYFHAVGYKVPFKPTIEQVLNQIPVEYLKDAVAFRVEPAFTINDYLNDLNYLKGKTTLYKLADNAEVPEKVRNQDVVIKDRKIRAKDIDEICIGL